MPRESERAMPLEQTQIKSLQQRIDRLETLVQSVLPEGPRDPHAPRRCRYCGKDGTGHEEDCDWAWIMQ